MNRLSDHGESMSGKSILAIDGAPRRGGATATLVRRILSSAEAGGNHVRYIRLGDLDVRPCKGCFACRKIGNCVIKDDLEAIHKAIDNADIVVWGSPTYWGNMSSQLKAFFDRSVFKMESFDGWRPRPRLTGKEAVIVTSCASPFPASVSFKHGGGTIRSIKKVMRASGFKIRGRLINSGSVGGIGPSKRSLVKAEKIGSRI